MEDGGDRVCGGGDVPGVRQSGLLRAGATLREQPEGLHHAGEGPVPAEEPLRLSSRARGPHQGEIKLSDINS